ncbi:MAG: hypothetical protein IJU79_06140 [Desulfovibrionaceae bacterium]|nr:hypothetical protein [Desulfovibrionaceae bacterium]
MSIELKVYGHIYPASLDLEHDLQKALEQAIQDEISNDVPLLERDNDIIRISFEGIYFPIDDVVEVLEKHLTPQHQGKLDVLDLYEWTLTRYTFVQCKLQSNQRSLNHVLDYSGF